MQTPTPCPRPNFALWRYDHNLSLVKTAELIEQAAAALGLTLTCSDETVRLMCLPFGNPRRRVPGADILTAIAHMTAGKITEADFYELRSVA